MEPLKKICQGVKRTHFRLKKYYLSLFFSLFFLAIIWGSFSCYSQSFNDELNNLEPKLKISITADQGNNDVGFAVVFLFEPIGKGLYPNEIIQCNLRIIILYHNFQPLPEDVSMVILFQNAWLSDSINGSYSRTSMPYDIPSDAPFLNETIYLKYQLSGNNQMSVNLHSWIDPALQLNVTPNQGMPIEPNSIRIQIESSRVQLQIASVSVAVAATAIVISFAKRH